MKTLYLHIGMPKTGTSSIQKFLLYNHDVLQKHGYCFPDFPYKYPYVYRNRNGYFLIGKQYRKNGSRNISLEEKILEEGMAHVCSCFETCDNVILTEETLWRCLHTRSRLLPYLKEHSDAHGYQIRIIVYLRRQDQFLISLWKQNVKHSKTASTQSFEERLSEILQDETYLLEYASRLDEIADILGKDSLIVRSFEPDSWLNDSLIDDFLHCIGLEHTEDFADSPADFNPSLSENMTYIKRLINMDASASKKDLSYLGQFLRELSASSCAQYPCSMLSVEETEDLLARFAQENASVKERYFSDDGPLFSGQIKPLPKWQPDNPYLYEDTVRFFSSAIMDLHRENQALRKDLIELQNMVHNEQHLFRVFKAKLKHPFRTFVNRLFHHKKEGISS